MVMGTGLAKRIAHDVNWKFENFDRLISGTQPLFRSITETLQQLPKFGRAAATVVQRAGGEINAGIEFANSIDDFLHIHRHREDIVVVGKAAIASAILQSERESRLYFDWHSNKNLNTSLIADSWYIRFIKILCRDCLDPSTIFDNVTFINFNYDRCLEHFLGYALQKLYIIPAFEAWNIVRSARIHHVYGQVGILPEMSQNGGGIEFGSKIVEYVQIGQGIKTYTEQVDDNNLLSAMGSAIADARAIVFLGFAFHPMNLGFLQPRWSEDHPDQSLPPIFLEFLPQPTECRRAIRTT